MVQGDLLHYFLVDEELICVQDAQKEKAARQDHTSQADDTFAGPQEPGHSSPLGLTHARPAVTMKQKHGMLYIPEEVLPRIVIAAGFLFIREGTN